MYQKDGLEIERRFLLFEAPNLEGITSEPSTINQIYLLLPDAAALENHRLRKRVTGNEALYYYTSKIPLPDGARHEKEREIEETEYLALAKFADPARRVIRKTRHIIVQGELTLELDLFAEELAGLVILEAELDSFEIDVPMPKWAGPFAEITRDYRFTNYSLSAHSRDQIWTWISELQGQRTTGE